MAFFLVFFLQISTYGFVQKKIVLNEKKVQVELTSVQQKIKAHIILKQRQAALDVLNKFQDEFLLSSDQNKSVLELKDSVRSLFFQQETQDFFESSVAQSIQAPRLSEKNIIKCLESEPDNLLCRWQYLKILRFKNSPDFPTIAEQFKKDYFDSIVYKELVESLSKTYANGPFEKKSNSSEFPILGSILEFERAFKVKNFSLAKTILQQIQSSAPDYPEILYMTAQLSESSTETPGKTSSQQLLEIYKKNCKNLSMLLTRKYYYDIDLCQRD